MKPVALVTGASRGIGKAVAIQLASQGFHVIVNYERNEAAAKETVAQITDAGHSAEAWQASIAVPAEIHAMVDGVVAAHGGIALLVNNAGITRDKMLMLMKEGDWNEVISVNLLGAILCAKAVMKPMIKARRGKIINISSISAFTGTPGQSNYASAKAGLIGFTRSLAVEAAGYGITINAIAAGYVETEMVSAMPAEKLEGFRQTIPLRRFATTEEVAHSVLYLASEGASYITGHTLVIDGGYSVA